MSGEGGGRVAHQATVRSTSVDGGRLRSFIERIERLREEKRAVSDGEKAAFAEAKADGYTPKYLRAVIKLRTLPPSQREEDEAMMDLYLAAVGMAKDAPLFRAVDAMDVDRTARDSVVAALKLLAPHGGEIVIKMGGSAVRIWRDDDGDAHAEDVVERLVPAPQAAWPASAAAARPEAPACSDDEAEALGRQAARDDKPIIANPFPWGDRRRPRWDLGWRREAGSDGMGPSDPGAPK